MYRQLVDELRVLGLRSNATFEDVKASYRRLARQYHPDLNPSDRYAQDKFIRITQAYQRLTDAFPNRRAASTACQTVSNSSRAASAYERSVQVSKPQPPKVTVQVNPNLSPEEQALKQRGFEQLQSLLKAQRFPRAIALVDGLAQRLMKDAEVLQWQAITYQRWGRYLIYHRHYDKARKALKKALRIDPKNKSLWKEVNRDFQRMEHQLYQETTPVSMPS